jgi:hypothetical protein
MSYTFTRPRFKTSTRLAKGPRHGSVTVDLASLAADGDNATTTVAVAGAEVGDNVTVHPELPVNDLVYKAYVSAADTVTVIVSNPTAGAIDAPSVELRVVVWKADA